MGQGLLKLCLVFRFDALLLAISDDVVDERLGNIEGLTEGVEGLVASLQLLAVLVDVVQIVVDDDRLGR